LGDRGNAVKELKNAIELNPSLAAEAVKDDDFKSLHSDPGFLEITRKRPAG
jgi:hypothetical protein